MGKILAVALLAMLTAVALMEAGLRIGGWWMLRSGGQAAPGTGRGTILCAGDSWTYGAESRDRRRRSYPARLQQGLDDRFGRGSYRVVNTGQPGTQAEGLASRLPSMIQTHRPQVVVVLVGGGCSGSGTAPTGGTRCSGCPMTSPWALTGCGP